MRGPDGSQALTVLVIFHELSPRMERFILEPVPDYAKLIPAKCPGDTDWSFWIRRSWNLGGDLVLLEQDVVVDWGKIAQLAACREDVCVWEFEYHRGASDRDPRTVDDGRRCELGYCNPRGAHTVGNDEFAWELADGSRVRSVGRFSRPGDRYADRAWALGPQKISAELQARFAPKLEGRWVGMDGKLSRELVGQKMRAHIHHPALEHEHYFCLGPDGTRGWKE